MAWKPELRHGVYPATSVKKFDNTLQGMMKKYINLAKPETTSTFIAQFAGKMRRVFLKRMKASPTFPRDTGTLQDSFALPDPKGKTNVFSIYLVNDATFGKRYANRYRSSRNVYLSKGYAHKKYFRYVPKAERDYVKVLRTIRQNELKSIYKQGIDSFIQWGEAKGLFVHESQADLVFNGGFNG